MAIVDEMTVDFKHGSVLTVVVANAITASNQEVTMVPSCHFHFLLTAQLLFSSLPQVTAAPIPSVTRIL